MGRKQKNIKLPKRVLILCEGESEQIYLKGVKKEKYNRNGLRGVEIEMYQPKDYSPLGIVKEAKKRIKEAKKEYPFFSVWVVFDKNDHKNIESAFNLANNSKPKINIAFSNICFEYWVLLHFEQTSKYFENCKKLIRYIEIKHNIEYSKTMNIYEYLKDNINTAIKNCEWLYQQNRFDLESNIKPYKLKSYTDFDKLYLFLCNVLR